MKMARDHIGECFIGELTIAVGISIFFPSASVLWDLADDFLDRPFWACLVMAFGVGLAYACYMGSRRIKVYMLCAALLLWGSLFAVYAIKIQPTPMCFICVVVLMRICQRLRWAWMD